MEKKVEDCIKGCILTLNEHFDKSTKNIDDFMVESLKWYDEMKVSLENEMAKAKTTRKKRGCDVPLPVVLMKEPSQRRVTRSNSVLTTVNKEPINIMNDSISAHTRGARKNLRESKLGTANVTYNQNDTSRTTRGRGRGRGQNTEKPNVENDSSRHKRPAEEEEEKLQNDTRVKKFKQEQFILIQACENGDQVFKKPHNWRKKLKKEESLLLKNIANQTVEESQFFNAPILHSSPKENPSSSENNTFIPPRKSSNLTLNSPELNSSTVCASTPTAKEINKCQSPLSTSKDFIKDSEDENTIACEKITSTETLSEKCVPREKKTKRTKAKKSKSASRNSSACKGDAKSESLRESEIPMRAEAPSRNDGEREVETADSPKPSTLVTLENPVVEKSQASASAGKESFDKVAGGKSSKEKIVSDKESSDVKDSAEADPVNVSTTREMDLDVTKEVTNTTKRTKPVLKSKILDSKGNIIPVAVDRTGAEDVQEKGKILRSSSKASSNQITDVKVKEEVIRPSDIEEAVELEPIHRRVSNQENEPQSKRTKSKRTKTKKEKGKEATAIVAADTGRITRTKSKQAKGAQEATAIVAADTGRITRTISKQAKEAQEAAARKSGIKVLARKSVNKAKVMSIQLEKLKSMKVLKQSSTNVKAQTQLILSKLNSASKNHELLSSSSKLKSPVVKNNIICLGSHTKPPSTIPSTQVSGNILLTGKGKYESREKLDSLITPAKWRMSPEPSVKSATKIIKEDPAEKELLLKALKEKTEKAASKKDMAIKNRQKELKQKNEMKLMSAAKQRQKLELEKYKNIIQSEKEKEERHNLILQERKEGLEEKRLRKQIMTQKKLADTEERRRLVEEERLAKLKEQTAELEKKMLERQKELERQEKRAQEHLNEMKMREMFEKKQKEEQMLTEKKMAAAQSACKVPKPTVQNQQWNYKPRNENDYGLEDEKSDLESDTEDQVTDQGRIPLWAKRVKKEKYPFIYTITQEMVMEYMPCYEKTPDIQRMFGMTPSKKLKRTSSAIWNTSSFE